LGGLQVEFREGDMMRRRNSEKVMEESSNGF
jgi:hypothetical protein